MKIFECGNCKSTEVFASVNGNNTGLYCADCGKWIKWLNKDELRLAERQINSHEQKIRAKAIDEFAEKLSLEVSESIIWGMLATMSKNSSLSDTSDEIVDYVIDTSKKIAEQLKAGDNNE